MTEAAPRASYQLTFAVLAAGATAYALLQSLVVPVLPTLQVDLHTTQNTVTWVLTAYLLSASIFTPIMGRIGDMIGKERVFVATLIALAVGSLLAAVATEHRVMIVARVIQGIGGGVMPLAFGIVRDEFPKDEVASAVGIIASLARRRRRARHRAGRPDRRCARLPLAVLDPDDPHGRAAVAAHFFVPESPVRSAGPDQLAAGDRAVGLAGRAARRPQRGADVGMGLGEGRRLAGRRRRPGRRLGRLRAAGHGRR